MCEISWLALVPTPGRHNKPRKNGGVFKTFRVAPRLWWKGRATLKTVERNLYSSSPRPLVDTYSFVQRGKKVVQLVKFIDDLGDDIRVTPGFGFNLRPCYSSLGHTQSTVFPFLLSNNASLWWNNGSLSLHPLTPPLSPSLNTSEVNIEQESIIQ